MLVYNVYIYLFLLEVMKLKKIRYISLLLAIMMLFSSAGCALNVPVERNEATIDEADATRVYLGKSKSELKVGDYALFTVVATTTLLDGKPVYTWESSDESIATVDSRGRVDAFKEGTVTISAVAKQTRVDYELKVIPSDEVEISNTTAKIGNEEQARKNIESNPDKKPYALLVNARNNTVVAYTYNPSKLIDGETPYNIAVREMVCSLSATNRVTQDTEYRVDNKDRWYEDDNGRFYQFSTSFSSGMRFCSAPYASKASQDLIYEEYNKLGTNCTDGDVWLCAADAQWIYDNCDEGTMVMVRTTSIDPLGVPEPILISEDAVSTSWDPTDSHEKNPYKKVMPKFEGVEDTTIKLSEEFNPLAGVIAYDTCMTATANGIGVDGTVPTDREGTYVISYYFIDNMHRIARADRKITVKK